MAADRPRRWSPASASSVVFVAVQWPFANFLMTPLARNWFFGTAYMDFSTPARLRCTRGTCSIPTEATPAQFWRGMLDRGARLVPDDVARHARRTRDAEGQAVTTRRSRAADRCVVLRSRSMRRCPPSGVGARRQPRRVPRRPGRTVSRARHRPAAARRAGRRRRRSPHDLVRRQRGADRAAAAHRAPARSSRRCPTSRHGRRTIRGCSPASSG